MTKLLTLLLALSMITAFPAGCAAAGPALQDPAQASLQDTPAEEDTEALRSAEGAYTILVRDADDGLPIADAIVQFCSDTQCMMGQTDAGGAASFEADPGMYTAHLLVAPEGYETTQEEIVLTADHPTAVFALSKTGSAETADTADTASAFSFPTSPDSQTVCEILPAVLWMSIVPLLILLLN